MDLGQIHDLWIFTSYKLEYPERTKAQLAAVVTIVNKKLAFLGEQSVPAESDVHSTNKITLRRFRPQGFIESDVGEVKLFLCDTQRKDPEIDGRSHSLLAILDIHLLVNPVRILLHGAWRQH